MTKTYTLQSPKQIAERVVGKMFGGKGSGNIGHEGLANVHGGSLPKGVGGGTLQKQAKKYKTVEEFVESQRPTSKELINLRKKLRKAQSAKAPEDSLKRSRENPRQTVIQNKLVNELTDKFNSLAKKEFPNRIPALTNDAIGKFMQNRQQFTNIWNEARKNG